MKKSEKEKTYCCIDGCNKTIAYIERQICQMHYFRFMRNGTYDKTIKRKYRVENPAGYQKITEKEHPLSDGSGYVYEHRFVYYNHDKDVSKCSICGTNINWKTLHIDHIDDNVRNNDISNLRATCRNCNTTKGRKASSLSKTFIEYRGIKLSVAEWARRDDVKVAYQTIRYRLLNGISPEDAIFGERKTHQNTITKKTELKYMENS